MNSKIIFVIIIIIAIHTFVACEPENQTDYVQLTIPEALLGNEEAVEKLKDDAKNLNNVFNSLEDAYDNLMQMKQELQHLDTTASADLYAEILRKNLNDAQSSLTKFTINLLWFSGKDFFNEKGTEEIIAKMTKGETIHFNKCIDHLKMKKETCDKKSKEILYGLEELTNVLAEKNEILERKYKTVQAN